MESSTRLYKTWDNMKQRCYNPHHSSYARYGGRGITVCNEWKTNYHAFKEWALSHGYESHLTIDRIDNDKGYSPDNCRWLTIQEQQRNRSIRKDAIWVTIDGQRMTLKQAAERTGQKPDTFRKAMLRREKGVKPIEVEIQLRKECTRKKVEAVREQIQNNPHITNRELAEKLGYSKRTIRRLKKRLEE